MNIKNRYFGQNFIYIYKGLIIKYNDLIHYPADMTKYQQNRGNLKMMRAFEKGATNILKRAFSWSSHHTTGNQNH